MQPGSWTFVAGTRGRRRVSNDLVIGLAYYQEGKDIVFRFIIEYSSLRDFGP
jgi:hypothetical protein